MIIDTSRLAGASAYLRSPNGMIDLVHSPATGSVHSGEFQVIGDGVLVEVDSIDFYLQSGNLVELFRRQSERILAIELKKEMFPGLFSDPYRHRVHAIGGLEDFRRGELQHLRAMDVDGVPVLVSAGTEESRWTSAIYRFGGPATLKAAAWDLATSRLTPEDGFRYSLGLQVWAPGSALDGPFDAEVALATGQSPAAPRMAEFKPQVVSAYRVKFEAQVRHDAYLRERLLVSSGDPSLGRPLLRGVSVLESAEPAYDFHSLQELTGMAGDYKLLDGQMDLATRLTVNLPMAALLSNGEGIRLLIPAGTWEAVEARLNGRLSVRPPMIDKLS